MRAQNLTISIPNKGCDKGCPYCVSKMTGYVNGHTFAMKHNVPKIITLARTAQVTSVLLTGKGEPFLNIEDVLFYTKAFSEFPVEVQTNGRWLAAKKNRVWTRNLARAGMNVISVSIDSENDPPNFGDLVKKLHEVGLIVRVTFNITEKFILNGFDPKAVPLTFKNLIKRCKVWEVDQMTLRNICIPNNTEETPQTRWIKENVNLETYDRLKNEMTQTCETEGFLVRNLPYGSKVYEYDGISVSYSDYCIQDSNNTEDIRSLIYLEDGGLYTSWNSKASRLF